MASKIRLIAAKLKAVSDAVLYKKVLEMIKADEQLLLQLNKQQLFESEDSRGRPLGFYASVPYAHKKGRETIDLKYEGFFYAGFFIDTEKFPIVFNSKDSKTPWLVKRFGKDIFGLSKGSLNVYIQGNFKKRFAAYFRSLLHV